MSPNEAAVGRLLNWAVKEKWNWFMALPMPFLRGPEEFYLQSWLRALERYDATWSFRYMVFTRTGRWPGPDETEEFLVLVGGLGSGEWHYWSLRWAATNRERDIRGRKLWSDRDKTPLGPVLRNACEKGDFLIQMQHGVHEMGYPNCLKVDEHGIPYDPKLRKALKKTLTAAERKALELPPGITVTRNGTRWQNLLADLEKPIRR